MKKLLKKFVKKVPIVGDVVENIESRDAGSGNIDLEKLSNQIIRILLLIGLIFGAIKFDEVMKLLVSL